MLTCFLVALDVVGEKGHLDLDLNARTVSFLALFDPGAVLPDILCLDSRFVFTGL